MKYEIKKLTLEIDGKIVEAVRVSDEELQKEKELLKSKGMDVIQCNCGDQFCSSSGYWWVCNLGSENYCQWFSTDWRCNG